MSDLSNLTYLLKSALAVSLSEYVGYGNDGRALLSETRLQYLNDAIKRVVVDEECGNSDIQDQNHHDDDDIHHNQDESMINSSWATLTTSLYNTATAIGLESSKGSVINACFNPEFAKQLKKQLLPYLPLWTGIMTKFFKKGATIATSSSVEAEFNDLKNRAFKNQLPMRIHKFVLQHLDHLDGKLRLASNPIDLLSNHSELPNIIKSCTTRSLLTADKIETTSVLVEELGTNSDCQSLKKITLDSFSMTNMKHSTPNSTATEANSSDQKLTIRGDSKIVELSSIECVSPEPRLGDSSNSKHTEGTSVPVETVNRDIDTPRHMSDDHSSENRHLRDVNICENWRCLGQKSKAIDCPDTDETPEKRRAKPSYLDKCPEWDFIKNAQLGTIPMFKNGFLSSTVKMGSSKLNITRTCAFDSIIQIILIAIATNETYR